MKIMISGCNAYPCVHNHAGSCNLPAYGRNEHGSFDTIHEFDYNILTGQLHCRNKELEEKG